MVFGTNVKRKMCKQVVDPLGIWSFQFMDHLSPANSEDELPRRIYFLSFV